MMRRIRPSLRKAILGLIYASALLLWVALVADTAGLPQQATTPPQFPTAVPPAPTHSPALPPDSERKRVGVLPAQVLQDIATSPDQRLAGFHPKTGRYISAWLPDSFDSVNRKSFEANADILDEVSPFWYSTNSRGDVLRGAD